MAKYQGRPNRSAAQGREKLLAPRQAVTAEEPMHRWTHPIAPAALHPQPSPQQPRQTARDNTLAQVQTLELLQCQNQLLVDLLEAVNSLSAALLARGLPESR